MIQMIVLNVTSFPASYYLINNSFNSVEVIEWTEWLADWMYCIMPIWADRLIDVWLEMEEEKKWRRQRYQRRD